MDGSVGQPLKPVELKVEHKQVCPMCGQTVDLCESGPVELEFDHKYEPSTPR